MRIETLKGGYDDNLMYVVAADDQPEALIVDASLGVDDVAAAAQRLGARPTTLALTHSHGDHTTHAAALLERWPDLQLVGWGRAGAAIAGDRFRELRDGERFTVGALTVEVRHTPGHCDDSICLVCPPALFSGDTLFVGRTGRTQKPGQSARELYRSIAKLADLDDGLTIYPGHDYGPTPTDTLGHQRQTNPFLLAGDEDAFVAAMEAYEASR